MKQLLNYNKPTIAQEFGSDILQHGVQVLRFNGAGTAEPVAWIDEEPLEVLRQLDRNQARHKFRVIVLDWNCLILICKPATLTEQVQRLEAQEDSNLEYFHNITSHSLYENIRRNRRYIDGDAEMEGYFDA